MGRGFFGLGGGGGMSTVLLIGIFGAGAYLTWVNRFPPFDKGGLVDQLMQYLPSHKGKGSTPASQRDASVSDDLTDDSTNDSSSPSGGGGGDYIAPGAGPTIPPVGFGPGPTGGPMGMQFPGSNMQSGIMQTSRASDPTSGEFNVYQNYAKGLEMLYGQGNRANLGPDQGSGIPGVVGDPNLGTTPVPGSLFQSPQGQIPPGYPPNGQGGYPYPNQVYGNPSVPPGQPFLPNPTQYPGPVQPGPYPSHPPVMPPPPPYAMPFMGIPMPPADIFINIPGRPHHGLPFFRSPSELISIDLGNIYVGFDGIRIGDLIRIGGGNWHSMFPHGIDMYDQSSFTRDVKNFVNKLLKKIKGKSSKQRQSILKQIIIQSGGGGGGGLINIGGSDGGTGINIPGLGGLGGLLGNGVNISQGGGTGGGTSINIPGLGSISRGGGPGGGISVNGFGNLFNGSTLNGTSMIPASVQQQLQGLGMGNIFQSNAGFVLPNKAGYLQRKDTSSLQPFIKRRRSSDDTYLFRLGNHR